MSLEMVFLFLRMLIPSKVTALDKAFASLRVLHFRMVLLYFHNDARHLISF